MRCAFVIPLYNHAATLATVVERAREVGYPIIIVDDGSTDGGAEQADRLEGVAQVIHHPENRGKGAALISGMEAAAKLADWAVSVDADGQHDPREAFTLVAAIPEGERRIVIGAREGMDSGPVPWTSRFGRKFSNFWIWAAGGHLVSDSQSGFRVYPLPETLELLPRGRHFQYEVELLVLARWKRLPVRQATVGVVYQPRGVRVSNFRPWVDFWRNSATFTRLIATRLLVPPWVRARRQGLLAGATASSLAALPPGRGAPPPAG